MNTDPIATKTAEILAWLERTGRKSALSGSGYIPQWLAAEWLGVSNTTLRRWEEEGITDPMVFKRLRTGRGHWQVQLTSLAQYDVQAETRGTH